MHVPFECLSLSRYFTQTGKGVAQELKFAFNEEAFWPSTWDNWQFKTLHLHKNENMIGKLNTIGKLNMW